MRGTVLGALVDLSGRERVRRACRGEAVDRAPVWIGGLGERALPLPVDAVAALEDLLAPLPPFGRVRARSDVDGLRAGRPRADATVTLRAAEPERALVAVVGAPFALAVALCGGVPHAKAFAYHHGAAWERLMDLCADMSLEHLVAHAKAGVDLLEARDPWAERLAAEEYARLVLPATQRLFRGLHGTGAATLYSPQGSAHLEAQVSLVGADVLGVDWRVPLEDISARLPHARLAGNLDPTLLLAPESLLRQETSWMLEAAPEKGYLVALGAPLAADEMPAGLTWFLSEATQTAAEHNARGP